MSHIAAALRRLVRERAGDACEYCLVPESMGLAAYEVDHIIALKHDGVTEADNLALSCPLCNKHKGTDLASMCCDQCGRPGASLEQGATGHVQRAHGSDQQDHGDQHQAQEAPAHLS